MVYLHYTGMRPGPVQGTRLGQWETINPGPCLGPMYIVLTFDLVPVSSPGAVPYAV